MSRIDVNRTFQIAGTNGGLVRLVTHFEAAPWLHPVGELGEKADLFQEASGGRLVLQEQMVSTLGRGTLFDPSRNYLARRDGSPAFGGDVCGLRLIWDEDHDERVIEPIEAIYWAADLASFSSLETARGPSAPSFPTTCARKRG